MSTDHLMSRALATLNELDGPLSVEVIHRLVEADEIDEPLTIAQTAAMLDVSAHTLRYYEDSSTCPATRRETGSTTPTPCADSSS